jgi:alkanesulfonate monooxygenase SsuD/methylene tetrahydromethanopterin reductase-like flavin-dependent oxidoreductase (luciferase family)
MLVEAATIRELQSGELVTWEGDYFRIDPARVWDAPEGGVPIPIAMSGGKSVAQFAPLADHLVAVEPEEELIKAWDREKGSNTRKIGQVPICWDPNEQRAIQRAHDQFRWFGGWVVNADLPTPGLRRQQVPSTGRRRQADTMRPVINIAFTVCCRAGLGMGDCAVCPRAHG